ncbi:MAG: alpha/beta fold hydrolase [Candidatus Hodarchaeales archaeon]
MAELASELKQIFSIPDLLLLDIAHSSEFILVISNKDNIHNVYKIDLNNPDEWIPVTRDEDRVVLGKISPDDAFFVYAKSTGGKEKHDLFLVDMNTIEVSPLLKLESTRVFSIDWSPDGQHVIFSGSTDTEICLWRYNIKEKSLVELYSTKQWAFMGQVNPEKPLVSWIERVPGSIKDTEIKIFDYHTGELKHLVKGSDNSENFSISWNENGLKLLIASDAPSEMTLAVWDMNESELIYMSATELGLALDYSSAGWLPGKDEIIYAACKNGATKLYREKVGTDNLPIELPLPEGWISLIKTVKLKPERIILGWSNLSTPTQILDYDIAERKYNVIASSLPPEFSLHLADMEFVTYKSFDGRNIPAIQVNPSPEKTLPGNPLIILIHGGPSWAFSNNWQSMAIIIQLYASAGFTVFCPNIRGSTGYGKEFLELNLGDLGGGDMKDVLKAKEYLQQKYPDSKQVFITGASYGGFMTFLVMTKHPGTFKAGAAIVGITDWFAMHRLGDRIFKSFDERFFLGTPEEKPGLYRDRSAINFVENLSEPLLIIHRENDSRCPVEPIYTFIGKAIVNKKDIEFYIEKEAGHGFQRLDHLEKQYSKVVEFFIRNLN